jgi:RimJ/RimL family protein N-acetyltransferase
MKTVKLKDGSELVIRNVMVDDAEQMAQFKQYISQESDFLSFGKNEIEKSAECEAQLIQSTSAAENSVIIIAVANEEIAGFVTFNGGFRVRKKHSGDMGIAVRKQYWGKGIGNLLMEALIEWARNTKTVRKINLLTRTDNAAAISLYEKYGFTKEGILTRDVIINGIFYDSFSMGLFID